MISALHRAARLATAAVTTPCRTPASTPVPGSPYRFMCRVRSAGRRAGRPGRRRLRLAMPDADLVRAFRAAGGGHKPVQAGMKVNWDADRDVAAEVAHRPVGHLRAAVSDQRQASNCPANSPLIAWRGRRNHRVQALTGTQRSRGLRRRRGRSGPTW